MLLTWKSHGTGIGEPWMCWLKEVEEEYIKRG